MRLNLLIEMEVCLPPALAQVAILLFLIIETSPSRHTIIVSKDGDDGKCESNLTTATPCRSLEGASHLLKRYREDVTIIIEDNVTLLSVFLVANTCNIQIEGTSSRENSSNSTLIQCGTENAGFVIDSVCNFSFTDLTVNNCTVDYNQSGESIYFSMLIRKSSNAILMSVHFKNHSKTALVLENNMGQIMIKNSSFINYLKPLCNNNTSEKSYPGALSILQNTKDASQTVAYTITGSLFHKNASPFRDIFANDYEESAFRNRGYGGAVFIEFGGNTTQSSVTISHSIFSDNCAISGGWPVCLLQGTGKGKQN